MTLHTPAYETNVSTAAAGGGPCSSSSATKHPLFMRVSCIFNKRCTFLLLACFFAGTAGAQTCNPDAWKHVYHPQRLKVVQQCVTVTGTLVDATHGKNKDGARHEADGDTHAWLKLDPGQENLLLPGNLSTQQGNMVFELVCYYRVSQADAKPACQNYRSQVKLPPLGSRIAITGALIEDLDHKPIHREIHPVSSITIIVPHSEE